MKGVEYWYNDDKLMEAQTTLKRAIGQYARHNDYLYIGLTQQKPNRRFSQHKYHWTKKGYFWRKMIVIYKSGCFTTMQFAEDMFIRYAQQQIRNNKYQCRLLNSATSRRPRHAKNPNAYWVYILIA